MRSLSDGQGDPAAYQAAASQMLGLEDGRIARDDAR